LELVVSKLLPLEAIKVRMCASSVIRGLCFFCFVVRGAIIVIVFIVALFIIVCAFN